MEKKIKPAYLFVVISFLMAGFVSMVAVAKNDNASEGTDTKNEKVEKVIKEEKASKVNENKDSAANLKNYQKADVVKGETDAKIYKEKTTKVIKELEQVKDQKENVIMEGAANKEIKNEAKKQIEEVVAEQLTSQNEVVVAIEEVEKVGATKKLFLGPDYKNLGQLRSELVHNRNQIRKLTQAIGTLSQNGEDTASLQTQLTTLTQERERIKNIITTNQEEFSFFGWVSRFLNNYEQAPINEEEEAELTKEVEEIINESPDEVIVNDEKIPAVDNPASEVSAETIETEATLVP